MLEAFFENESIERVKPNLMSRLFKAAMAAEEHKAADNQ